ncbi:hypothetical protein, partial [Escherichia coli]|uniref:hypothetical protein n=1 Tax=Escherichia coli TaxID=562 RepID=UPI002FF0B342
GRAATTGRTGAVFNLQPPGCRGSSVITCRDYSAYLLPSASVLLRFLADSRALARSPDCGEH